MEKEASCNCTPFPQPPRDLWAKVDDRTWTLIHSTSNVDLRRSRRAYRYATSDDTFYQAFKFVIFSVLGRSTATYVQLAGVELVTSLP